jgi:hypothetical protein
MKRVFILFMLVFIGCVGTAYSESDGVIVIDLRKSSGTDTVGTKISIFSEKYMKRIAKKEETKRANGEDYCNGVSEALTALEKAANDAALLSPAAFAALSPTDIKDANAPFDYFRDGDNTEIITACSSPHFISKVGDEVKVYIAYGTGTPKITFKEIKRNSMLSDDLMTVIQAAVDHGLPFTVMPVKKVHRLEYKRSDLTVTAKTFEGDKELASAMAEVKTGPVEHWYLSADVALTEETKLKYDSASSSLVPKDKPNKFMLGLNWKVGDRLSPNLKWYDAIVFKGMLSFSDKPLDTVGLGVGIRSNWFKKYGLDVVSPFIGAFWTKEDTFDDGIVRTDDGYSEVMYQLGVSFNIDRIAGWLGGGGSQ